MELKCCVQNYTWGKRGESSFVAYLMKESSNQEILALTPYAELWMGIHPNGPSLLKSNNQLLSDYLQEHPDNLGDTVLKHFGRNLPFLFKILSVETALSIQAHPAKAHAEELFIKYPNIYKDPNHKPEIAIALTKFEALCGFRPIKEIQWFVQNIPELNDLLEESRINDFKIGLAGIRPIFESLMNCDPSKVKSAIDSYLINGKESPEKDLTKRLNDQFPGDVGVLCVFLLNYVILQPGEAIFLAPNEPHAYIFGDCVECMSNSDNVVRAGLTPKFRDVQTLCDMLTYKSYDVTELKLKPVQENEHSLLFNPPIRDFAVVQVRVPKGEVMSLKPRDSCSILIAINGKSTAKSIEETIEIKAGVALFIPSRHQLTLTSETDQTLYQAFSN